MRLFRDGTNPSDGAGLAGVGLSTRVRANLESVKTIIAIASARGGTGKSSILINLAAALAQAGRKVAILDADLNSPSVIAMLGMKPPRGFIPAEWIDPNFGPLGLRIVGSNLLPDNSAATISFLETDAVSTPELQTNGNGRLVTETDYSAALGELLSRVRYGALDLLLIDLPPGTEAFARLNDLLPRASLMVISHPSDHSARANRRLIEFARERRATVLGIVENMVGFSCDSCHTIRPLMPQGEVGAIASLLSVPLLEKLPFDPRFAETCDRGTIFVREFPESPLAKQLIAIAHAIGGTSRPPVTAGTGN